MAQRFVFPISSMRFVSLTEPMNPIGGGEGSPLFYSVAFPVGDLPGELAALVPKAVEKAHCRDLELFSVRSRVRPVMCDHTKNNRDLHDLRIKCSDANIRLDRVMRDVAAEIVVCAYSIEHRIMRHIDAHAIALEAVRFDAGNIKVPGWDDIFNDMPEY